MSVAVGLGGVLSVKQNIAFNKKAQEPSLKKKAVFLEDFRLLDSSNGALFNCNQTGRNFTFIADKSGDLAVNARMMKAVSDFLKKEQIKQSGATPENEKSKEYYKQYLLSVIVDLKHDPFTDDCQRILKNLSYELLKSICRDFQTVLKPILDQICSEDKFDFFEFVKEINEDSSLSLDTKRRCIELLPVLNDAIGLKNILTFYIFLKNFSERDLNLFFTLVSEIKKKNPFCEINKADIHAVISEVKSNPFENTKDIESRLKRIFVSKRFYYIFAALEDKNYFPTAEICFGGERLFRKLPKELDILDCTAGLLSLAEKTVYLDLQNTLAGDSLESKQLTLQNMEKLITLFEAHDLKFVKVEHFLNMFKDFSRFSLSTIKFIVEKLDEFNSAMPFKEPSRHCAMTMENLDLWCFLSCSKYFQKIDQDSVFYFFKSLRFSYIEEFKKAAANNSHVSFRFFYQNIYKPLMKLYTPQYRENNEKVVAFVNQILKLSELPPFSFLEILKNPKSNAFFLILYREIYEMTEPELLDFFENAINFCEQFKGSVEHFDTKIFIQELFSHLKAYSKSIKRFAKDLSENQSKTKAKLDKLLKIINDYKQKMKEQGKELPENQLQLLDDVFLRSSPK